MSTVNAFHKGVRVSAHRLTHDFPATCFNEAFPIGNGRIGAMVYGQTDRETMSLNDDTLWAGTTPKGPNRKAREALPEIRRLIFEGRIDEAETLIEATQQVEFVQPYLPAGFVTIDWPESEARDYTRELSLEEALATVEHEGLTRRYFASEPDQTINLQCEATDKPLSRVVIGLGSKLNHKIEVNGNTITLKGRAPTAVIWEDVHCSTTENHQVHYSPDSRPFAIVLTVLSGTGTIRSDGDQLSVEAASDLTIRIALATDAHADVPEDHAQAQLSAGLRTDAEAAHISAHRDLYDRISLNLKGDSADTADDTVIDAFLFNYARYLMISSARTGTMPANLQGIWNEDVMPPWWSNYTVNINTEMNYWMAEACGLSTCHSALITFVESLVVPGRVTAAEHFGCRGWVLCHQTDYRRTTAPIGFSGSTPLPQSSKWSMWPFGGAWLSLHLFEHYRYNPDQAFLEQRAFPVMLEAALFLVDWLIPDPKNPGFLTTAPSTSPENSYLHPDGYCAAITTGSAMDMSIAKTLFASVVKAAKLLGADANPDVLEIAAALTKLPELNVAGDGTIAEFGIDVTGAENPHRHISQLFALTPGHDMPDDLLPAARKTLDERGLSGTGWALAWKAKCWARLGDAARADETLRALWAPVSPDVVSMANAGGGLYPNMLTACPPMQIDANFGFGAALLDMVVQADEQRVLLLPAVPDRWASGELIGLQLPGGLVLDLRWSNERVTGQISGAAESPIELSLNGHSKLMTLNRNETARFAFDHATIAAE